MATHSQPIPEFVSHLSKTFNPKKQRSGECFGGYTRASEQHLYIHVHVPSCSFILSMPLNSPYLYMDTNTLWCPLSTGGRTRRLSVKSRFSKWCDGNLGREATLKGRWLHPGKLSHMCRKAVKAFPCLSHAVEGERMRWRVFIAHDQWFPFSMSQRLFGVSACVLNTGFVNMSICLSKGEQERQCSAKLEL